MDSGVKLGGNGGAGRLFDAAPSDWLVQLATGLKLIAVASLVVVLAVFFVRVGINLGGPLIVVTFAIAIVVAELVGAVGVWLFVARETRLPPSERARAARFAVLAVVLFWPTWAKLYLAVHLFGIGPPSRAVVAGAVVVGLIPVIIEAFLLLTRFITIMSRYERYLLVWCARIVRAVMTTAVLVLGLAVSFVATHIVGIALALVFATAIDDNSGRRLSSSSFVLGAVTMAIDVLGVFASAFVLLATFGHAALHRVVRSSRA